MAVDLKTAVKGYGAYIRVMAMLPASNVDIARAMGIPEKQGSRFTRGLRAVGLVSIDCLAPCETPRQRTKVYRIDAHARPVGKPAATMIAFASLWRALDGEPKSKIEIADETGIHPRQVQDLLRAMREAGLVRIGDWCKRTGDAVPLYHLGSAPDAQRPARDPRDVVQARWRKAQREKRVHYGLRRVVDAANVAPKRTSAPRSVFDLARVAA